MYNSPLERRTPELKVREEVCGITLHPGINKIVYG
jgi:hypothetical protein